MKPIVRRWAEWILRSHLPTDSAIHREWADAMRRELDFIESDWDALFWAIGSVTVLHRNSVTDCVARRFGDSLRSESNRRSVFGRRALGFLAGAGIAGAVVLVAFGLLGAMLDSQQAGLANSEWVQVVTALVLPEIIFVCAIVMLRKKRPPVAAGIGLLAAVLVVHVVIHLATQGR
jgi:hypothetical protein